MEKITEEFDWDRGLHSKNIYNWDEILNGDTNKLERGIDFEIDVKCFVRQARHIARRRGLGFKNKKIDENTVVVRAFKYEKGEGPREGIGEKIITESNVKGYRIFGDKLEEITGVKSPEAKPAVAEPLSVTHGQIANVKGGVYVN